LRKIRCLNNEEIDYLEALYSYYRIQIGNKTIKFNKGVAQGSILSPALFNIFIEDLVIELATELNMSIEDILLYADDILILCQSQNQIQRCIEIIEKWSQLNGMELNKKKSGVLAFTPRGARKIPLLKKETTQDQNGVDIGSEWVPATEDICGVPVVTKYKYLGTYFDPKLSMNIQIDSIKKKSNFLFTKLYPYLSNATADARKDMWRTMVLPLFNALLILLYYEKAKTNSWKVMRLLVMTFKRYLLIPKNTSTTLVYEMMGIDISEIVASNAVNSEEKWEARKDRRQPELIPKSEIPNYLRGIPNDWCLILKQQCSICPICRKSPRNESHMSEVHNIDIHGYYKIWASIKSFHDRSVQIQKKKSNIQKVKRTEYLEHWGPKLRQVREETEYQFNLIYTKQ
jgi:hypothetical protein